MLNVIQEAVGIGAMMTTELDRVGSAMFGDKYIGTFAYDQWNHTKHGYQIINLDVSTKPGSHWIAMHNDGQNMLVYDSFGREVIPADTDGLIKIHHTENDAEQDILENNCGQRCLAWLKVVNDLGIDIAQTI